MLALLFLVLVAPTSSSSVPEEYARLRDATRDAGRAVVEIVRSGSAEALHARLTEHAGNQIPRERLGALLENVRSVGPLGDRADETAVPLNRDGRLYVAEHHWGEGDKQLRVTLVFDERDHIAQILLEPLRPVPPDPHAGYQLKSRLRLPFDGTWWVFWGGQTRARNVHLLAPGQRHALDIVAWQDGGTHHGDGTRNEDYWCWGRPILAPADGTIVVAADGLPDNPPGQMDPRNPPGNCVLLDLGQGEYALLAHLQNGSLRHKVGEKVKGGDVLGLCGNSGNSSEPHLHFHVQDSPELRAAKGLPLRFENLRIDGEPRKDGVPVQGQFVEPQ